MPSLCPEELTRLKPLATAETVWTCRTCDTARPVPLHLVVELQREDTWTALGDLLYGSCGGCGHRSAAAHATMLTAGDETGTLLGYLLLPVQGTPSSADIEEGRRFLGEHRLPPVVIAGLLPSGWPAADTDLDLSVLTTLETDLSITSQVARYERRRRVMTALLQLSSVTSPGQIRETLGACPELVTDGADVERELLSIMEWPPEAACLAEARAALIRGLTSSVTDAELERAYEAFDKGRNAGMTQIVEAGYRKARWLAEHLGAPAAEWDQVAAQALHLLGLGGEERGRAGVLEQEALRAGSERAGDVVVGIEGRDDHDRQWIIHLGSSELARCLNAVEVWHSDVEQAHVGP